MLHTRVRLTRKLAERIDGVDLSRFHVGEIVELPLLDAKLLVAHGWAISPIERRQHSSKSVPSTSADCDWNGKERRLNR